MSDHRLEILFERFRRQGDVEALGQVFDATASALRRVARHVTRDAAEAEDLVQATFLAAIEKRATFDDTRELSPWLTGILLREASLARRARARVIEPDRVAQRAVEDPQDAVAARELSEALTNALARLSTSDREVLIPLLLDGRRAVEIARELGRRPDTVHMRIHRGLARLRQLLPAGIALGVLAKLAGARGLGAVRAEVLRRASVQVQGASLATAGVVTVGLAMSMKKIAVVVALVLVLGIGGYQVATGARDASTAHATSIENTIAATESVDAKQAPTAESARAAVTSTLEEPFATAREPELVFDVVREDGSVASFALVALVSADGRFANQQTDENGCCAFALDKLGSSSDSGHFYVRDDAAFPQHFAIELVPGRRTIELSRGAEFSGRIVMKGDMPLPRFELQLTSDSAPQGLAGAGIRVFRALELLRYDDPYLVARTTPSADGAFRFRVPDSEWSGILRLPPEFVFVDGANPTRSSERVILRATTSFEATVGYRPRIIGRIVDEATGAPVADAMLDCELTWTDGNGLLTGGVTDTEGRFTIALDGESTDATELRIDRVSTRDGRIGHVATPSTWKGPCEPFDAADIECTFPASRSIGFRAFDPSGTPLAQTCAAIRGGRTAQAAQHGVGTLFAVPFDATEIRFVAPGHAITTVAITADTPSPIDVVLARTNRLTIALPREAVGRRDLQVKLVSRPLLFGGTSRMYDQYLRNGMVGHCFHADGDKGTREGSVRLGFSDDGRIELEGIATGVLFRIQLVAGTNEAGEDDVRQEVAIESLGPEEQRRVDLELPLGASRSLIVVRGRVVDERGRPIHGAALSSQFGAEFVWAHSELDGTFHLDWPDPDAVDIEASKRGYVPFRVRGWDVTSDRALEAILRRGRDLRVELVDAKGRAIGGAKVSADIAGFGAPWKIEEGGLGIHTLCDIPQGRAEITIELARTTYARSHDGSGDVARFVIPEHGRLEVSWTLARARHDERRAYQLALRPLGTDGSTQTMWVSSMDEHDRHVFEAVLPGEYTVGLEVGTPPPGDADTIYAPLREPKRITIRGGETLRIEL